MESRHSEQFLQKPYQTVQTFAFMFGSTTPDSTYYKHERSTSNQYSGSYHVKEAEFII